MCIRELGIVGQIRRGKGGKKDGELDRRKGEEKEEDEDVGKGRKTREMDGWRVRRCVRSVYVTLK